MNFLRACGSFTLILLVGTQVACPAAEPQTPPPATAPASRPAPPAAPMRGAPPVAPPTDKVIELNPSGKPSSSGPVQVGPLLIDPLVVDFGLVPPRTKVNKTVTLKNTTAAPVKILKAEPTCQCTSFISIAGKVIPPGESIPLELAMETPSSPIVKVAAVNIACEGYNKLITVKIQCEVTLSVRAVPPFIDIQQNPVQKQDPATFTRRPLTGTLKLESLDRKPFRILSFLNPELSLDGFDPAKDAPQSTYTLKYDFTNTPCERIPKYVILETDRADCPAMDIRVRHECAQIAPSIAIEGFVAGVGRISPGGSGEIEITIKKFAGDRVVDVLSGDPATKVEVIEQRHDGQAGIVRVRITPKPGTTGLFTVPVTVTSTKGKAEQLIYGLVK